MRKFFEYLKNTVLVLLAIAMLTFWTGYIYLQFDREENETPQLSKSFWIFNDTSNNSQKALIDNQYFTPVSVSLIFSGNGYTSAFNESLTAILYNDCQPLINEIFSSSYTCRKEDYSIWQNALDVVDSILIEYASPLPYTTIALFSQNNSPYCNGELCYIEKLLIFSDSSNVPCAVSIDGNGNVFSFSREDEDSHSFVYDFNSSNLAAYTVNEGFIPFEFNKKAGKGKTYESLSAEYKLFTSPLALPSIIAENPLAKELDLVFNQTEQDYFELVEQALISDILDIFEVNPNIVGYYSNVNTGLTFVDENMRLSISPTGVVSYSLISTASPIITTASLLNTSRVDFNSSERLTAATLFISKFPKQLLGNQARLIFEDINYNSQKDEMTFSFGYYCNLSSLQFNEKAARVSLTFNSVGLSSASIAPFDISLSAEEAESDFEGLTTDILPSVVANISDGNLFPVYNIKDFGKAVAPIWAVGGNYESK